MKFVSEWFRKRRIKKWMNQKDNIFKIKDVPDYILSRSVVNRNNPDDIIIVIHRQGGIDLIQLNPTQCIDAANRAKLMCETSKLKGMIE